MKKSNYTLGLDLGIASTGYALVDIDENRIIKAGVHLFETAEDPKTGASLAAPRREARSARRRLARRRMRLDSVLNTLKNFEFQDVDRITETKKPQHLSYNPWQLRSKGLERQLTDLEFGIAVYHLAKHRGFRSSRLDNSTQDDKEKKEKVGKMKKSLGNLESDFDASTSPTIGHYLFELFKHSGRARNKAGDYALTVLREWTQKELESLCEKQSTLGHQKVTQKLREQLDQIIFLQRPLKPAKIGNCKLIPDEKRAVKNSFSAEQFIFWNQIINLRIDSEQEARALTTDERRKVLEKSLEIEKLTFKQLRKLLHIDSQIAINLQRPADKDSKTLIEFKGYYTLRKAIEAIDKSLWQTMKDQQDLLDHIATVLSIQFDEQKIEAELRKHTALEAADPALISKLCEITSFKGTVSLSLDAINILLPYMKEGEQYNNAVKMAKAEGKLPTETSDKHNYLPPVEKTNNPVVDRALSQARKVVNAIIREYGSPKQIKIELARDVGKSRKERKQIENDNKKNEERNNQAKTALGVMGINSPTKDIVDKYKLWIEQNKLCPYSGQEITQDDFKSDSVQVDHIIPYSRSFDDSFQNKVLVFSSQNQNKGNRTPHEWLSGKHWQNFEDRVRDRYLDNKKKLKNLLIQEVDDTALINRNLNDTRWISLWFKDHIKETLVGIERVDCTKGGITYTLRRNLLLDRPKDRAHHSHHAEDAILISLASASLIQKITKDAQRKAYQGRQHTPILQQPWETFSEDVNRAISEVQITRMPNRKYSGAATKETIMSYRGAPIISNATRLFNDFTISNTGQKTSKVVKRIGLANVKLKTLESMVDLHRNQTLYTLLKQRLEDNKDDSKKAFAEPVYMPKKDGTQGPQVKGFRIYEDSIALVPVQNGVANNGDMVRIDIFKSPEGFVISPLYVMDVLNKQLPQVYVDKSKERPLNPEWKFQCTLQKNDYVELINTNKKAKERSITKGFYLGFDRSNGSIKIQDVIEEKHKLKTGEVSIAYLKDKRLGIKTLDDIRKYYITLLGEKHLMRQKERTPLNLGQHNMEETKCLGRC